MKSADEKTVIETSHIVVMVTRFSYDETWKQDFERCLLYAMCGIMKIGQCTDHFIAEKNQNMTELFGNVTGLIQPCNSRIIKNIWMIIKHHLDGIRTTMELIIKNFTKVIKDFPITNLAIVPLLKQFGYYRMFTIENIATFLVDHRTFPIFALCERNATINSDMKIFDTHLDIIERNQLAGYTLHGVSTHFLPIPKTLGYLAMQIRSVVDGVRTLNQYREIGSRNNRCINSLQIDSLVLEYSRHLAMNKENELKLQDHSVEHRKSISVNLSGAQKHNDDADGNQPGSSGSQGKRRFEEQRSPSDVYHIPAKSPILAAVQLMNTILKLD